MLRLQKPGVVVVLLQVKPVGQLATGVQAAFVQHWFWVVLAPQTPLKHWKPCGQGTVALQTGNAGAGMLASIELQNGFCAGAAAAMGLLPMARPVKPTRLTKLSVVPERSERRHACVMPFGQAVLPAAHGVENSA